jgi:hypothetical protein
MDVGSLKAAISAEIDAWAAQQPLPLPVPPTPAPPPPVPVPAPPGASSGPFQPGTDITTQLVGLLTEFGQQGGGEVRLGPGAYQISGRIPLFSGVSLLRSTGTKLAYVGDPSLPAILESPSEDCLQDCRVDVHIDEGAFAGDVVRLHSGFMNHVRVRGFGQGGKSRLLNIKADSTGGQSPDGSRNFVGNVVDAQHWGACNVFANVEGLQNGFNGQPQVVTLNEFDGWFGANCVNRGVTAPAWADNNVCTGSHRFSITGQNGIGIAVNEGNPTVETGVYAWLWEALAIDTWGAVPNGPLGRIGVYMGASKLMQCDSFHQQPPAERGALVLHPNAISVYFRGRFGNDNQVQIDERDVQAILV